jgi:hypothetical protein
MKFVLDVGRGIVVILNLRDQTTKLSKRLSTKETRSRKMTYFEYRRKKRAEKINHLRNINAVKESVFRKEKEAL